jgi:hypothetical protein
MDPKQHTAESAFQVAMVTLTSELYQFVDVVAHRGLSMHMTSI